MSTTSTQLGTKIKALPTAEDMWKVIIDDATLKSTLYILDAEDQLSSMKLADNNDPKAHLTELKAHFQLMLQRCDNLMKIGLIMSDTHFNIIIMSSLPESYQPTLQTITTSEQVIKLSGLKSNAMKADNLIAFILEEAQHHIINDKHTKTAKSALAACTRRPPKSKGKKKVKAKQDITCENCNRPGHRKLDCYLKGGGKKGQAPWQTKNLKPKQPEMAVIAVDNEENELFAFPCTSDHVAVADKLDMLQSKLGTCIDSGASGDYCPDQSKFIMYRTVHQKITTANGRLLDAIGMGDLELELPNGSEKTKTIFKNAVHTPKMAFTLISISRLNRAGYSVTFNKGMCTIRNPQNSTIATIPHSDGLYKIAAAKKLTKSNSANAAPGKMLISNAHRKLGHISCLVIKHVVIKGLIEGIDLDINSKLDFCEACTKAKSAC